MFQERIDVVELSLGDVVPSMSGFKVLPQRRSGELARLQHMQSSIIQ